VTVDCSRSYYDSAVGCKVTEKLTATMTRSGNTVTGMTTFTRVPAPSCEYQFGYCVKITFSGTRVGDAVSECSDRDPSVGASLLQRAPKLQHDE
jgi:hypothetical protein